MKTLADHAVGAKTAFYIRRTHEEDTRGGHIRRTHEEDTRGGHMRRRTHEEDTRKRTHGREHTEENTRVEDSGAIAGGVMEALMIQS